MTRPDHRVRQLKAELDRAYAKIKALEEAKATSDGQEETPPKPKGESKVYTHAFTSGRTYFNGSILGLMGLHIESAEVARIPEIEVVEKELAAAWERLEELQDTLDYHLAMAWAGEPQKKQYRKHYEPQIAVLREKIERLETRYAHLRDTLNEGAAGADRDATARRLLAFDKE